MVIGGDFIATRSIEQSFGLMRVPGVEGVSAYSENQVVGKTNSKGDLVVPSLLPYYGNQLSIDPEGIPLNYKIGATDKVVAPPFRGGQWFSSRSIVCRASPACSWLKPRAGPQFLLTVSCL